MLLKDDTPHGRRQWAVDTSARMAACHDATYRAAMAFTAAMETLLPQHVGRHDPRLAAVATALEDALRQTLGPLNDQVWAIILGQHWHHASWFHRWRQATRPPVALAI